MTNLLVNTDAGSLESAKLGAGQLASLVATPKSLKADPNRRCIVCGKVGRVKDMLRFVASPESQLVFDRRQKLGGRGLWLCATLDCLTLASNKPSYFRRASQQNMQIPSDLASQVEQSLRKQIIQLLSLCRRAGLVVGGHEKVHSLLSKKANAWVLIAADIGQDSLRLLRMAAKPDQLAWDLALLTGAELAEPFGKERLAQLGLVNRSGLIATLINELQRLRGISSAKPTPLNPINPNDPNYLISENDLTP